MPDTFLTDHVKKLACNLVEETEIMWTDQDPEATAQPGGSSYARYLAIRAILPDTRSDAITPLLYTLAEFLTVSGSLEEANKLAEDCFRYLSKKIELCWEEKVQRDKKH